MSRAVLSIGANLGDRLATLRSVVAELSPIAVSGVYETAPWGPVPQDDYLNAIVVVDDPAVDAHGWLHVGQRLEAAAGRVRDVRWGPRTLDVDVVAVGDPAPVVSDDPVLTLPHPRAAQRAFVLVPWLDADPAAILDGVPVADRLAALPAAEISGVRRRAETLR